MTNNQTPAERLDNLLFFQSEPQSGNMLADWQKAQAKQSIIALIDELLGEVIGTDIIKLDNEDEWDTCRRLSVNTIKKQQHQRRQAIIEQLKGTIK